MRENNLSTFRGPLLSLPPLLKKEKPPRYWTIRKNINRGFKLWTPFLGFYDISFTEAIILSVDNDESEINVEIELFFLKK